MENNLVHIIKTDYISASKTIESIMLSKKHGSEQIVYVYNYEGTHYRLFLDLLELVRFFNNSFSIFESFENEQDLDNFLLTMQPQS